MQYDFNGRNDLVKFIKEIRSQGLYVCLRIGPFVEAEWNYGYTNYKLKIISYLTLKIWFNNFDNRFG